MASRIAIPTSDAKVRLRLRELAQPTTLFGERDMDRRLRLRTLLAQRSQHHPSHSHSHSHSHDDDDDDEEEEKEEEEEEEFYTEGPPLLVTARRKIACFSLQRAKHRVATQQTHALLPLAQIVERRKHVLQPLTSYTTLGSQIGDHRPISITRFSPNSQLVATGSWSGSVKLWSLPAATHISTLRAHTDKIGGLAWHPHATLTQRASVLNLVSSSADTTLQLWSLDSDRPLATLTGHTARVVRSAFHPCGDYIASASFDATFRVWDTTTTQCISVQHGHSRAVYAVDFHPDGSLLASGGLDSIARVWDLRSGTCAMVFDGHARDILAIHFSPNGYTLATAGADNTVRICDLRALSSIYTIPAHSSSVCDLRFFHSQFHSHFHSHHASSAVDGLYFVTGGYDGVVRIWSADDWLLVKELRTDDAARVMSVDVAANGEWIVSGEWGRTFKLWATP